jgi:CBS domain containing-hemolysin-like protein
MMQSSHSRLPVYGDTTVITFREAFRLQREWHGVARLSSLDLEKIMKVSLTQALDDLFEKFQRSRRHIALVLDEHGGTAWVVTMEDVLEEVFGDIKDEKDREEIYMKKWKNGSIEAIGSVLIDDILEEYNLSPDMIELPEEYMGETLSYVLMAEEEWFPKVGDIVSFGDTTRLLLRVLSIDDNVIERVECRQK